MNTFVSELAPTSLWIHFDQLLRIPRGSKNEAAAREWVLEVARRGGHESVVDEGGNVLVRKSAAPGREGAPSVALQAHLDMVQEKNSGTAHDFATDPIRPLQDGPWLKADGTTLGADNGIGVAAMLALLEEDDLEHGPLEFLFTVDEETGLTGAKRLDDGLLQARRLINLDSEEEGVITIGCAGGADTLLFLPLESGPSADLDSAGSLRVSVSGLKGGHSGVDIDLQRGNAIAVLVRALLAALDRAPLHLVALNGGNARNAIPREAAAEVRLGQGADMAAIRAAVEASLAASAEEFARSDPGLTGRVEEARSSAPAFDEAGTRRALELLGALPHGVQSMSTSLPGLVETSTNLAVVGIEDGELSILCNSRSSVASRLSGLRRRIRAVGRLAGARVEEPDGYPAWQPDVDSPLLAVIRSAYEAEIGEAAEVGAMHAGLECGIIGEKYPEMDMVAFGPQIEFPHSPDERVRTESVAPFYRVLRRTIEDLASA